jgi:hypothetical protein
MAEVNILLVEDDEVDVMAVKRALKALKIANPFFRAADGIEGLEMLRGMNGKKKLPHPYVILLASTCRAWADWNFSTNCAVIPNCKARSSLS